MAGFIYEDQHEPSPTCSIEERTIKHADVPKRLEPGAAPSGTTSGSDVSLVDAFAGSKYLEPLKMLGTRLAPRCGSKLQTIAVQETALEGILPSAAG
jgi:hypothetical protein